MIEVEDQAGEMNPQVWELSDNLQKLVVPCHAISHAMFRQSSGAALQLAHVQLKSLSALPTAQPPFHPLHQLMFYPCCHNQSTPHTTKFETTLSYCGLWLPDSYGISVIACESKIESKQVSQTVSQSVNQTVSQ